MRLIVTIVAFLLSLGVAQAATLEELAARLPAGEFSERAAVVVDIAGTGDPRAAALLQALSAGDLATLKSDGRVVRVEVGTDGPVAFDPISGASIGPIGRRDSVKIKVNNDLRDTIAAAIGTLTLRSPDAAVRSDAALSILRSRDAAQLPALETALAAEVDEDVAQTMREARAAAILGSAAPTAEQTDAIATLARRGDRDALSILSSALTSPDPAVAAAAQEAVERIQQGKLLWEIAQNILFGLSLGSVLMLAAIGLAISFGVMGVINMAHGELVMLGAYTTYFVQEIIRTSFPGLFDWSLLIALPLAFVVSGGVGVAIERGICRHLYGRPLETLLATWGVSLILQQAVRSIFGPNNREVGNPSWMSGAFEVGELTVTWNRLWIIVFALVVFAGLQLLLKKTPMGLQMRAVTQNRRMAAAMGVRTSWVDAMTFGLGAGVAGIAGVALSQIGNVSPNLGQSYIVDSFMVVVFGGVGNLWGALAGAFTLGVANKFLEPFAGAVLAKVLVLVAIILFIQKRPRGMFALKGRAVEG